jgi:hypothetical protein
MGCGQGAVEVVLTAPSAESARPVGATQVALRAVASDGEVITRSAAIVDGAFDLGALPIADYLGMTVELRDDVGGQVGFGRSTATLEVQDDGTVVYPIPVRRPRLYLGGHAAGIRTTDPLDGAIAKTIQLDRGDRDVAFATRSFAPSAAMAAAGADLYVASGSRIFRFDSDADALASEPLADVGAPIVDLAGTGDGRWLAAATPAGVALVEIATGARPTSGIVGAVAAVTFSRSSTGAPLVVGLADAVTDGTCPRASRLLISTVPGDETSVRTIDAGTGLADLGGAAELPRVVAAGYCAGAAITYDLESLAEVGRLAGVPQATAVAVARDRAFVAGTQPGVTATDPESGIEYTTAAAFHQLAQVTMVDGSGRVDALPPIQQTVYTTDEDTATFSQTIRAKAARVTGLVASPTGDRVTVLTGALLRNVGRLFAGANVIPPMAVHASYAFTVVDDDNLIERLRSRCMVCTFDASAEIDELGRGCGTALLWTYANWACSDEPGVANVADDLELGAGAALFGQP